MDTALRDFWSLLQHGAYADLRCTLAADLLSHGVRLTSNTIQLFDDTVAAACVAS